jgi:cellulose synthase operon protein C
MKQPKIKYIFIICLFASLAMCSTLAAQESSVVSAMLEEAGGDLFILDDIISEHAGLLNKYPTSDFAPTLMFQLAELNYERSQIAFQNAMPRYEEAMAAFQNGDAPEEPVMPQLDMSKTIHFCTSLLLQHENIKFRDRVIYKLAVAYMDAGDQENAKKQFSVLTSEAPDSPMALESHFRIGEYFFEKRQFDQAIAHYKVLLNHWDNPFFDMALYKLGWSYYNQQNYPDAISNFLVLIKDINLVDSLQTAQKSIAKMDLRTESIHYIASSFSEYGGAKLATEFLEPLKEKNYVPAILIKLAELYENRNAYAEAIASYRVLLDFYPFHATAPRFFDSIVENYETAEDDEAAIKTREEIITYFRPGSAWQHHFPTGDLSKAGLSSAKSNLVYLGTTFQALAQAADSLQAYTVAIEKYLDYIQTFPKEENTSEIHYYLAESYYNTAVYDKAAAAYYDVTSLYPHSSYREKAAFNRIFSFVQLFQPPDSTQVDTLVLKPFILTGDSLALPVGNSTAGNLLSASNDFCTHFPESEWIDQVYMKFGEVLNTLKHYVYAAAAYQKVYDQKPASQYRPAAAINVGQCLFDGGYFNKANTWFENVAKTFADSSQLARKAKNMAASSKFKIAENSSQKNEPIKAANVLLTIAASPNEAAFQERALFEAAVQFQSADSLLKAARTFERLAQSHPKSELGDKALYQAAMMRESLQNWQLAAHNYLTLVENYAESPLLQQSLKNAAQCYVNAEKWIAAKTSFLRYAEMFPENYDEVIEFTCQGGDMAYNAGQEDEAMSLYEEALLKYNQFNTAGQFVDAYFAAQAQFMIGEIQFKSYRDIELMPPLQKNFKRKVTEFNNVAKSYTATIKFQIADWSTAASHRIGMSFEEFVRAFLESPIPDDLDEEQQATYKETLKQRAQTYQDKALETYQKNIEQAEANNIDNSWVADSRKRIQALTEELIEQTAVLNSVKGS